MHAALEWLRSEAAWLLVNWRWWVIPVGTAILNLLSRVSAETWERWGATRPRLQAGLRLLRAVGIDPHTALVALRDIVAAKAVALGPRAQADVLTRLLDAPPPPTVREVPPLTQEFPKAPTVIVDDATTSPETPEAKK